MNGLKVCSNGILYKLLFLGGFFLNYSVEKSPKDIGSLEQLDQTQVAIIPLETQQLTKEDERFKKKREFEEANPLTEEEKEFIQEIEAMMRTLNLLSKNDPEYFENLAQFFTFVINVETKNMDEYILIEKTLKYKNLFSSIHRYFLSYSKTYGENCKKHTKEPKEDTYFFCTMFKTSIIFWEQIQYKKAFCDYVFEEYSIFKKLKFHYLIEKYHEFINNKKKQILALLEKKSIGIEELSEDSMTLYDLINKKPESNTVEIEELVEMEELVKTVIFMSKISDKKYISFFFAIKGKDKEKKTAVIYQPIIVQVWREKDQVKYNFYVSCDNMIIADRISILHLYCVPTTYEKDKHAIAYILKKLSETKPKKVSRFLYENFKNIQPPLTEPRDNIEIIEEGDYEKLLETMELLEKEQDERILLTKLPDIIDQINKIRTNCYFLDTENKLKPYKMDGFNKGYCFANPEFFGSNAAVISQLSSTDDIENPLLEKYLNNINIKFAKQFSVLCEKGSICQFSQSLRITSHRYAVKCFYSDYKEKQ
jgi:hypothetical protein